MAEEIKKYDMTLPAEDIDSRLKKIQEGGVGYTDGETIHQIEAKYLPGVTFPYVELTTPIPFESDSGVTLSADEVADVTEAIKGGMPVCVKANLDMMGTVMPHAAVYSLLTTDESAALVCWFTAQDGIQILLSDSSGTAGFLKN